MQGHPADHVGALWPEVAQQSRADPAAAVGGAGASARTTRTPASAEVVRQRQDVLRSALKALGTAEHEASRLMLKGRHQLRGLADHVTGRSRKRIVRAETAEFEARLREVFQVLDATPEDARRALLMEAQHLPPCEHGFRQSEGVLADHVWWRRNGESLALRGRDLVAVQTDDVLNGVEQRIEVLAGLAGIRCQGRTSQADGRPRLGRRSSRRVGGR